MGMQKTIKINVNTNTVLWPYQVVDEIQKVMEEGEAKHPNNGWVHMTSTFHVLAGIGHAVSFLRGKGVGHLDKAFTRLMMVVAIERGYTDA